MDERDKYPSELAERFQIRLPTGLRDRIKSYAERHNRSMNAEILRILEREFPEPWPVSNRAAEMVDLLRLLKEGGSDETIGSIVESLDQTIQGILSGRVRGVDSAAVESIRERYYQDKQDEAESDAFFDYDDAEMRQLETDGTTAKFEPALPERKRLGNLTEEELEIYALGYEAGLKREHGQKRSDLDDEVPF